MNARRILPCGLKLTVVGHPSPYQQYQLLTPFGGDTLEYFDDGQLVTLPPGSAHFFEHVLHIMPPLKNGTPLRWRTLTPKRQRNLRDGLTLLDKNKARLVNAYTWKDITNYWFAGRENTLENLETVLEYVFTPYLPHDRFKKEVGTISDEIRRAENNSSRQHYQLWLRQAYQRHGARHSVLGTMQDISRITVEDVLSLHRQFYRPSNMQLIVTGNVNPDFLAERVQSKIEQLGLGQHQPPPQLPVQEEPDTVGCSDNFCEPLRRADVSRPTLIAGWRGTYRCSTIDRHVAAAFALCALQGKGSALREKLVAAGADSRTYSGDYLPFRDHAELVLFSATEDPKALAGLLKETALQLAREGLPATEYHYTRNELLMQEDELRDSFLPQNQELARWAVLTGDPLDHFSYARRLEHITFDEVNAHLPEIFDERNFTACLMVPEK